MRAVALLVVALGACGKKQPVAELTTADGPVERQAGTGAWATASIGTKYYLGDAARTADGGAQLTVTGGAATIAMQPRTILRFGGTKEDSQIAVELGSVALTGTGEYGLDVGDVKLSGGTVRIAARAGGGSTVTLDVGDAVLTTRTGETIQLELGASLDVGDVVVVRNPPDAGVVDAPVADAAVEDAPSDAVEHRVAGHGLDRIARRFGRICDRGIDDGGIGRVAHDDDVADVEAGAEL
ncbi:MAG TPA: hypothetical protein VM513_31960, partial [Kofleriaceae bacterium]|nr:hypothetical protein [Kofleriaceae bacterium]